MKRLAAVILSTCILLALQLTGLSQPVGVIHETGQTKDGGTIYFIYANVSDSTDIYDTFNMTYFKGDFYSGLSLSQLKVDVEDQWESHILSQGIKRNTIVYSKPRVQTFSSIVNEDFSASQAVVYVADKLLNIKNAQVISTTYLNNNTILSKNISNEDGHIFYNDVSNILELSYTYSIDEQIIMVGDDEYLLKIYEMVKYKIVCLSIDLKLTQPIPTQTPTPTPTPTQTTQPSASNVLSPTATITPSATSTLFPSASSSITATHSPTQTMTPDTSKDPKPEATASLKPSPTIKPEIPKRTDNRYEDIWTYVILQALIILIILIIFLSRRKKR